MKTIFALVIACLLFYQLTAQEFTKQQPINDNIPAAELEDIHSRAKQYYQQLDQLKNITTRTNGTHVLFGWPLRCDATYDEIPNYYMIQNYVDDSPVEGFFREYNCNQRSYDGHNGTDISTWPFWWNMMDKNFVQVVAAAPGIVIKVTDNNGNDDNCSCVGSNNVISILHSDSTTSIYYHIKDNSALVKEGDLVFQAQPVASVGSSGCSSNPHLHFEVRTKDDFNNLVDPWVRTDPSTDCNNYNEDSWWQNQKPYWEPQVNRVMTHSAIPSLQGFNSNIDFCRSAEFENAKNNFIGGDQVFVGIAVHDYISATSLSYSIYYPNGTLLAGGTHSNSTVDDYTRWYLVFDHLLPGNAPPGTYKIVLSYFGKDYIHYFSVNCVANYTPSGTINDQRGYIASNSILSDATLSSSANVKMQAANYIQFNPGFTATAGTTLKARIKDCNYSE